MKMKKLLSSLIVLVFLLTAVPVMAAPTQSIVEIAVGNPEFSILVEALTAADLVDDLSGAGPFTVFAPTNDAFAALLTDLGVTKEELLAHPDLADVLLYHVLSGKVMSSDLTDDLSAATLQGEEVAFDLTTAGGPFVNDSKISAVDIEATNGVIHVIDKVLVPAAFGAPSQSIVDIAVGNPDFSILVAALQKADLVGALQGEGPFTVFAPTNAAFTKLLGALDITAEDLLAQPDLAKVLLHHVVSGKVMSGSLTDGLEADTLNGDKLVFDLETAGGPFVSNAKISAVDIEATNGVIHVIDDVMVPTNFTLVEIDDEPEVPQTGDTYVYFAALLLLGGVALLLINSKRKANASAKN